MDGHPSMHDEGNIRIQGAVPDGAVPDGAVPDGAVPDGAVPDDAVPDDGTLDGTIAGVQRTADQRIDEIDELLGFGHQDLEALFERKMPFGRYRGRCLIDLPEEYLLWFERSSFPAGNLGRLMQLSLGIKRYGAEPAVMEVRFRLHDLENR